MPLVIPGMQSNGGDDKTSKWMDQLMGKKLGESNDNVVCLDFRPSLDLSNLFDIWRTIQTFAKKDLPQQHRVVKGDSMMTMDHNPDRLNIHVGDDGTVHKVTHG
ncbi:hypothetical protein E4T47_08940 [Aureobasidium subglaciale]|nr:hypothetical protein E4T43_08387 [Aureobasidium subglaciale]KAI5263790.1 hypothetical protein E4T47_08940 [Aureobasidium subglaciale]